MNALKVQTKEEECWVWYPKWWSNRMKFKVKCRPRVNLSTHLGFCRMFSPCSKSFFLLKRGSTHQLIIIWNYPALSLIYIHHVKIPPTSKTWDVRFLSSHIRCVNTQCTAVLPLVFLSLYYFNYIKNFCVTIHV